MKKQVKKMWDGERLRKLRENFYGVGKEISQKELAEKINRTQEYISIIENNKKIPAEKTIRLLADFFHVSFEELIGKELTKKDFNPFNIDFVPIYVYDEIKVVSLGFKDGKEVKDISPHIEGLMNIPGKLKSEVDFIYKIEDDYNKLVKKEALFMIKRTTNEEFEDFKNVVAWYDNKIVMGNAHRIKNKNIISMITKNGFIDDSEDKIFIIGVITRMWTEDPEDIQRFITKK